MSSTTEYTAQAQDQVFSAIRQGQDVVVKAVESWANAVGKLPAPPVTVPFAEEIPSADEIVDTTFGFAQKLLDAQQEFARNLIKAAAPAIPGSAPAKAPRAAAKVTATSK
jgi:hypothetical protein